MTTKHCCYGTCRSDSRYVHAEHMKDVFYSIPEAVLSRMLTRGIQHCQGEKDTYICSLLFVGGKGPTADHPDPIPATATDKWIQQQLADFIYQQHIAVDV